MWYLRKRWRFLVMVAGDAVFGAVVATVTCGLVMLSLPEVDTFSALAASCVGLGSAFILGNLTSGLHDRIDDWARRDR